MNKKRWITLVLICIFFILLIVISLNFKILFNNSSLNNYEIYNIKNSISESKSSYDLILIGKAWHLNRQRRAISDIYLSVNKKDNIFSELIEDSEYVRVNFEKNLTDKNDITVYPRIISGEPKIEIYLSNSDKKVGEFFYLTNNTYNKVYLNNLSESYGSFDLKVINGSIIFDHIIDPVASFVDGAATGVLGTTAGTASTLANVVSTIDGTNLILAAVQVMSPDNGNENILAGNLDLYGYSGILASNEYDIPVGAISTSNNYFIMGVDSNAPAGTIYNITAFADNTRVNTEAKIIVLSGIDNYAFNDSISKAFSTTEVPIATVPTTFSSGNNVIVASVQIDNSGTAQDIAAGGIKIKNGNTLLSSNQYAMSLGNAAPTDKQAIVLLAYDLNAAENSTYNITIVGAQAGVAEAKVMVFRVYNASFLDGGSVAIAATSTSLANLSTLFLNMSDIVVISATQINDGDTNVETLAAGTGLVLNEIGSTKSANELIMSCLAASGSSGDGLRHTLLFRNFTAPGSPSYNSRATASATGLSGESKILALQISAPDTTSPQINITYPANISYNINVSELNYTIIETNPAFCWYSNSSGTWNSTKVKAGNNFTNITSYEGSNTWTVYCNDTRGNRNSSSVTFFKDTIFPVISITSPVNATNTTNRNLVINYTYVEANPSTCYWTNDSGVSNHTLLNCNTNITGQNWSEGNNVVRIYMNDTLGNTNYSEVSFLVDTINPNLNIVYPLNTSYNINLSNINYTYNDTHIGSCYYSNNSGIWNSTPSVVAGNNFTLVTSVEGSNTWTVYCNDSFGNKNSSSITFFKDTIFPIITITSPVNSTNTTNKNLVINYTYSEVNPSTCFWTNDSGVSNHTLLNCNTNITGQNWSEGNNVVRIYMNDTLGNLNYSEVSFLVDTIFPEISFGYNTQINATNISQNFIYVNVTINETNFANMSFTLFNSTGLVNSTNFSVAAYIINWTNLVNGNYYYNVTITDRVNHINYTETRKITLDTISPNANLSLPLNNSYQKNSSQNFSVNISDNLGIKNASLSIYNSTSGLLVNSTNTTFVSGTLTTNLGIIVSLADGIYKWFYNVFDWAGNNYNSGNYSVTIDTVNPNLNLVYPLNITYNTNVSELNYSYNDTNPGYCYYSNNSGIWNSTPSVVAGNNFTLVTSVEGSNTWTIYCNDSAGNKNSSSITFFKDTIFPIITITSPVNSTNTTDNHLVINYTYVEANPSTCFWTNDTGASNHTLTNCNTNVTGQTWPEGNNVVRIYMNDTLGNTNYSEVSFLVDTIYPNLNLVYPLNTSYNTNVSELNYTYNDTHIGNCWYSNNSGIWNSTPSVVAGNNFTFVTSVEGSNTWTVYCNDSFGNKNISSITFFKDTIYPIVNFGYGTLINDSNVSQNFIYVNVTINETNFANISFTLFNSTGLVNSTNYTIETYTINWSDLSDGNYYYNVSVFDSVNNYNFTETRLITLDINAPSANLSIPENNSYKNLTSLNFSANISDNLGIKNATLFIYNSSGIVNMTNVSFVSGTVASNVGIIVSLTDGIYKWFYDIFDWSENSYLTSNYTVTIDTLNPDVNLTYPLAINYSINVTDLNYTYNDTNLGSCWYSDSSGIWNPPSTIAGNNFTNLVSTEGVNTWIVYCNDSAGNRNSSSVVFFKDSIYPVVWFGDGTLSNGQESEQDFIYINVSVNESNEANISYNLYDSGRILINSTNFSDQTRTINWSGLSSANITYYYNVSVNDIVNNNNFTETRSIKLVDRTPPKIIITSPLNASIFDSNTSIPLEFSISEKNLANCSYSVDLGISNYSIDCTGAYIDVPEGINTLILYVNDSLGQTNSTNVTFNANSSLIITSEWRVERGSVDVNGVVNVPINKTDKNKAFINFDLMSASSSPAVIHVTAKFVNSTLIQFQNYGGAAATVRWEVITGPDLYVQSGEKPFNYTNSSMNIPISDVNLSQSFIIVKARLNSTVVANYSRGLWTGNFQSSTEINLTRSAIQAQGNISYQVIQWNNSRVRSGNSVLAGTGLINVTNILNPAIVQNRSFVIFSTRTTTSTNQIRYIETGGYIFNETRVNFYRQVGVAGSALYLEWFVVEAPILRTQKGFKTITTLASGNQTITQLINGSRTFRWISLGTTGSTTTNFGSAKWSSRITNTTNIELLKGDAIQTQNLSWQSIEIIDITSPYIDLIFPLNHTNFTSLTITSFNYSVNDSNAIINCSLLGNWTGSFIVNQTVNNPTNNLSIMQNFSSINVSIDGYYIWNVECTDLYGNIGRNSTNLTFAAFLAPHSPLLLNISQSSLYGNGSVILFWNQTEHTAYYKIYYSPNLTSDFIYLNTTYLTNYTDTSFIGNKRRFYKIEAWSPTGQNFSLNNFGAHVYYLSKNTLNTKNWIGFPTNFSYLTDANTTLFNINNATAFTMWNETIQKRVTCNLYSCPSTISCTDTNCNFSFSMMPGRGYEVNINSLAPNNVNWSGVGIVNNPITLDLNKNSSSYGKNWVGVYANTSLDNARDLLTNISYSETVTKWDPLNQRSLGYMYSPFPLAPYLGNNFNLSIEEGYEVSVSSSSSWLQE